MKYYLRVEGVNLACFIDDTKDLSTIRGGGLLLLNSVKVIENWVGRWEKKNSASLGFRAVTTGASNGLFTFNVDSDDPDDHAKEFRKAVADFLICHHNLGYATFVVDVQRADSNFFHDKEAILARNRWRQWQQPTVVTPEINDNKDVQVCHFDWICPASAKKKQKDQQVSRSVSVRRNFGVYQKNHFYADEMKKYFNEAYEDKFVNDLEALTYDESKGNLHHKMAVIYLDGNGFGKIQTENCGDETAQQEFDHTLKKYRAEALKSVLDLMDGDVGYKTASGSLRLETLLWGGDEIIWVVPAWKGWELLERFYEVSALWRFEDDQLSHAGGLVFCHHNAPIHRITHLCKKLAEAVKEENRSENGNPHGNFFQYLTLESYDHIGRDLHSFRNIQCPVPWKKSLDGQKMSDLRHVFAEFKDEFPKNKVFTGVHAALKDAGSGGATDFYDRFTLRLNQVVSKHVTEEIAAKFDDYFGNAPGLWLHIAELWDYIAEEQP